MIPDSDEVPTGMPATWYVAFYGFDSRAWWEAFTPKGFRHVLAFGYVPSTDCWLIYDVTLKQTWVRTLRPRDFDGWIGALPDGRRIVKFTPGEPESPALRLGFWCTRAVAHALGVKSRALRPYALWRELIARGAEPAFSLDTPPDEVAQGQCSN